ncbi:hypothetical protein M8C21_024551, partial [Ambrosia artemisiifolia]
KYICFKIALKQYLNNEKLKQKSNFIDEEKHKGGWAPPLRILIKNKIRHPIRIIGDHGPQVGSIETKKPIQFNSRTGPHRARHGLHMVGLNRACSWIGDRPGPILTKPRPTSQENLDLTMPYKCLCGGNGNFTTASCSEQERLALLKFKRSIKDDHGMLSSWGVGNDCCRWERVGCDDASGRVVSLHLRRTLREDYYLFDRAGLPVEDYNLASIDESYYLVGNEILDLGSSPYHFNVLMIADMAWISGLTKLQHLDLSGVDLSRVHNLGNLLYTIPSLLKLKLANIKHLDLSENDFKGCWIQNINFSPTNLNFSTRSNIQHLDLSLNRIEGRFPSVLTNMSSLLSLDLSENMLNSPIPAMPNLLKLDISANNFMQIDDVGIWRHCHIKELIGSYNKLKGEMIGPSTNVSKCSQNALEILYLDSNTLNFSIPESLGRLTNLRSLDLSNNELTGPFPEALGKLRALQGLYLSNNQLRGSIPESLGRLTSLRMLSVSTNFLNGIIPNSIGQLTNLHLLDISGNSLQGVVSEDHFANLSMLKYLNANYNSKLFFNISRDWIPPFQLQVIRLSSCKIEDGFPQWLRTQRNLEELVLSNARISGPLPTWLRLMPIIRVLDLSHNKLTGLLTNLPLVYKVRYELRGILLLQDNLFRGLIPKWLCKRRDLHVLDLSRNKLTGKIPKCLWNLSLDAILLSSNKLYGVLPSSLGRIDPSLKWLQLNDNNLYGELPHDFGYFINLEVLDLGENKISGNIPEWIGENVTMLGALRLHKNNFTGIIPHSLCKSHQLQILDLAHNNLRGSIPHCFGGLDGMKEKSFHGFHMLLYGYGNMMQVLRGVALDYTNTVEFVINLDLSSNKLVGEIPKPLTSLDALVGLNLSYNHFSGGIPKSIGNMKSLNSLDLSTNKLNGTIPPSMASLNFLTSKKKYKNANERKKVWLYVDIACGFATGRASRCKPYRWSKDQKVRTRRLPDADSKLAKAAKCAFWMSKEHYIKT